MPHADKRLLITGFDPFGGETVNPSWEAVRRLPDRIGSYLLTKLQIPTEFNRASQTIINLSQSLKPDIILSVGQAGGRKSITPEVVAINLREASIPDNAGFRPEATAVVSKGPAAYFSTVPVRDMVSAVQKTSIPCTLSYSAGTFVCNDVLYTLLHRFDGTATRIGFIHVPFLPEQAKENTPSLPLEQIVTALTAAIEAL